MNSESTLLPTIYIGKLDTFDLLISASNRDFNNLEKGTSLGTNQQEKEHLKLSKGIVVAI